MHVTDKEKHCGRQNLRDAYLICISQVLSSTVFFFCQLHAHTCPLYNVLLEVVGCCFPRNDILLILTLFIGSQNLISLPSFMFVNAVISEIRNLNSISNLTPLLGIF